MSHNNVPKAQHLSAEYAATIVKQVPTQLCSVIAKET